MEKMLESEMVVQKSKDLGMDIVKMMLEMPSEEINDEDSLSNEIKNTVMGITSRLDIGYNLGGDILEENLDVTNGLLARLYTLLTIAKDVNLVEGDRANNLIEKTDELISILNEQKNVSV